MVIVAAASGLERSPSQQFQGVDGSLTQRTLLSAVQHENIQG